jgi:hypothetical protein
MVLMIRSVMIYDIAFFRSGFAVQPYALNLENVQLLTSICEINYLNHKGYLSLVHGQLDMSRVRFKDLLLGNTGNFISMVDVWSAAITECSLTDIMVPNAQT